MEIYSYLYDASGYTPIEELDASNVVTRSLLWGPDRSEEIGGVDGAGGLLAVAEHSDVNGAQVGSYFYHYDGNSNVSHITDEAGSVQATYQYNPFGRVASMSGAYAQINQWRFSTKSVETWVSTELHYYGLRFYHAGMGRWLNRDPIEESGGVNLYAFISNDPINTVDVYGLCAADLFKGILKGMAFEIAIKLVTRAIPGVGQAMLVYDVLSTAVAIYKLKKLFDAFGDRIKALSNQPAALARCVGPELCDAIGMALGGVILGGGTAAVKKALKRIQRSSRPRARPRGDGSDGGAYAAAISKNKISDTASNKVTDINGAAGRNPTQGDLAKSPKPNNENPNIAKKKGESEGDPHANREKNPDQAHDTNGTGAKKQGCFVAGTLVHTASGYRNIEDIEVGDRVLSNTSEAQVSETLVNRETWRVFTLRIPQVGSNGDYEIRLLRPQEWMEEQVRNEGGDVWMGFAEMGVSGWAELVDEEPCPEIEPGEGRVVLMTITHLNSFLYEVQVGARSPPIQVTGSHPFYSDTAKDWVLVSDLQVGDQVTTLSGDGEVVSLKRLDGSARVYNFEVEAAHQYFVGKPGVLVHNACPDEFPDPKELAIAEYLEKLGHKVTKNPLEGKPGAGRQGDAFVSGQKTEFKTVDPGATSNTIRNTVNRSKKGTGQAREIVIDARGTGLSKEDALEGAYKGLGASRGKVDGVSVIGDNYFVRGQAR